MQLSTARILIRDQTAFSSSSVSDTGFNNSCLARDAGLNREGPRKFNCPQWVIESTDRIWNMYRGDGYIVIIDCQALVPIPVALDPIKVSIPRTSKDKIRVIHPIILTYKRLCPLVHLFGNKCVICVSTALAGGI